MICPNCHQSRAHRSHRSGVRDYLYHWFQMIPYRCQGCTARFYAYRAGEKSDRMRTREEQKIMRLRRRLQWKRSRRELAAFAVASVFFLIVVYLLIQQRIVSE